MGPQAGHIVDLWRIFLVTCTVVFAAILAVLLLALWRSAARDAGQPPDLSHGQPPEPARAAA
jgi:cytochrome c oxidase subunit 2